MKKKKIILKINFIDKIDKLLLCFIHFLSNTSQIMAFRNTQHVKCQL